MMNLPEYVDEDEVKSMFAHADKDGNGYINYREFTLMCKVPDQEPIPNGKSQGLVTDRVPGFQVLRVPGRIGFKASLRHFFWQLHF